MSPVDRMDQYPAEQLEIEVVLPRNKYEGIGNLDSALIAIQKDLTDGLQCGMCWFGRALIQMRL